MNTIKNILIFPQIKYGCGKKGFIVRKIKTNANNSKSENLKKQITCFKTLFEANIFHCVKILLFKHVLELLGEVFRK